MKISSVLLGFIFAFVFSMTGLAQQIVKPAGKIFIKADSSERAVKSSAAYAEVLLRKVELESDVESLLESYTEDYPKIKEARYELSLIQKDFDRLLKETDASRLSLPLGKLIVRKNQLETDLWMLKNQYGQDHPQVKRAARKAEFFRKAVSEILP